MTDETVTNGLQSKLATVATSYPDGVRAADLSPTQRANIIAMTDGIYDEAQGRMVDHWGDELPVLNVQLLDDLLAWAGESNRRRVPLSAEEWGSLSALFDTENLWQIEHLLTYKGLPELVRIDGYVGPDGQPIALRWEQAAWRCGTAACLAGGAALAAGWVPTSTSSGMVRHPEDTYRGEGVEDVGRELLGLTRGEALWIFRATNDVAALYHWANLFAQARGLNYQFAPPERPSSPNAKEGSA